MDIARSPEVAKKKKLKRIAFSVVTLLVVAFVTVVLAKLRPAAPTVERGTTWRDTVKRGEMLRQVRGPGTLVPEDIRWMTSSTDATVDRIVTLPSAAILAPDTVILELRDQKVQQALVDAELESEGRRSRPRQPEGPIEQRTAAAAVGHGQHPVAVPQGENPGRSQRGAPQGRPHLAGHDQASPRSRPRSWKTAATSSRRS